MTDKKLDLRYKIERPDVAMENLQNELIKVGGKKTKAYKELRLIIEYVIYIEGKMDRKDKNFQRMKKTIAELEEMTNDNKNI